MRKVVKMITPDFFIFLYKNYLDDKVKKNSVKNYPNVTAGKDVYIQGNCSFEKAVAIGNNVHFDYVSAGKNTSFSGQNSIRNSTIGKFCSIATCVKN